MIRFHTQVQAEWLLEQCDDGTPKVHTQLANLDSLSTIKIVIYLQIRIREHWGINTIIRVVEKKKVSEEKLQFANSPTLPPLPPPPPLFPWTAWLHGSGCLWDGVGSGQWMPTLSPVLSLALWLSGGFNIAIPFSKELQPFYLDSSLRSMLGHSNITPIRKSGLWYMARMVG